MSMQHVNYDRSPGSQSGAVLILALIIMLLTGLVSATVMRTSILEVKMVSNTQFKEEAFQKTESVVNAVTTNKDNFVVAGDVGWRICGAGTSVANCNSSAINLPAEVANVPTGVDLDYYIERLGPLKTPLPFRQSDSNASGANGFDVALFEVVAQFDGRDEKLGYFEVRQGVAVKIASSHQ